jgi:hypothetical protein
MNANTKPRFDWRAWSLLTPAIAYTIGLILYSGEGLFPGALTMHTARLVGAWLMVAGAEGGTLSAVIEVARKIGIGRARWYDYAGIFVSMIATVFNLLLVWSRESTLVDPPDWSVWTVRNGALADILAQVGDFYAGAAFELGLYFSYIKAERRAELLQDERDALGIEQARNAIAAERRALSLPTATADTDSLLRQVATLTAQNTELTTALQLANRDLDSVDNAPPTDTYDELADTLEAISAGGSNTAAAELPRMTPAQWRDARAGMNGDAPTTPAALNEWLTVNGYAPVSERTAYRWLSET